MKFVNLTPFPALRFEGVDQHDRAFHVVVLRQTLDYSGGTLDYANDQSPLCVADRFRGAPNRSSVVEESDLCHYKPRCDVLVDAVGHSPSGSPAPRFGVRLQVRQPSTPGLLAPAGNATRAPPRQPILLDKTLVVTGPRRLERSPDGSYALTEPEPIRSVPLHDERMFGGRCRVDAGDPCVDRIDAQHLLTAAAREAHPDAPAAPLADVVFQWNPIGCGFAQDWHLAAAQPAHLPAPQIEAPDAPFTAALFRQAAAAKSPESLPGAQPRGLGVRPKGHPERQRLGGTVDAAFAASNRTLPEDFDFAIWNCAWPDQQVDFLRGDETFLLGNLAPPGSPLSAEDVHGNTVTRLTLPGHECYLLIEMRHGALAACPMVIDTVRVEPEMCRVSLVWRSVLAKCFDAPIARVEARIRSASAKARDEGGARLARDEGASMLTRRLLTQALRGARTPR